MPLSPRQQRFYVYTVDLWRVQTLAPSGTDGSDFGPYALMQSAIRCKFTSAREEDRFTPVGRQKALDAFTMDRFEFDLSVDIRDTDFLHLVAVPNSAPNLGAWYAVHGNPQPHAYRAHRQRVLAKRTIKPRGAP